MRSAWAGLAVSCAWFGCFSAHPVSTAPQGPTEGPAWTEPQALAVLRAGVQSSDPSIRAVAVSAWIGSTHPSSETLSGWALADPSPHVQRLSARAAAKAGRALTLHPTTDTLAALWMESTHRSDESVAPHEHRALSLAIAGDEQGLSVLLSELSEGSISADSDVLDLLIRAELPGVGNALAQGSALAEEPIRLPMAMAAVALGSDDGVSALTALLRDDPGEELRIEAIEAMVRTGGPRAEGWLMRASKGASESVATHAKIGLGVSGQTSIDFVSKALDSPDRDTRAWAVQCLAMIAAERPLPRGLVARLQVSARDEAPAVRWGAVEALLAAAGPRAVSMSTHNSVDEPDAVSMLIAAKWLETFAKSGLETGVDRLAQ